MEAYGGGGRRVARAGGGGGGGRGGGGALEGDGGGGRGGRGGGGAVPALLGSPRPRANSSSRPGLHMSTSADEVWAALAWGAMPSVGLLVGVIAGAFSRMPHQPIAMAMSVGAGLLLAGVSLKLAADAIRIAGPMAAALSLLLGAAVFSASNALLARFGAAHRKRCGDCIQQPAESQQPGSGVAIALGNALDAAPEAMVLGIALRIGCPPRAGDRVLTGQPSGGFIEHSGDAGCRPPLRLHLSALDCDRHRGSGGNRGRVCWVRFAQSRVATAAAGIWSRSTARDGCRNDDSRGLPNSPRFSGLLAAFGFGLLLLVDATTR